MLKESKGLTVVVYCCTVTCQTVVRIGLIILRCSVVRCMFCLFSTENHAFVLINYSILDILSMKTVLMIAEKPSLALSIAKILSKDSLRTRKSLSNACQVHEYNGEALACI